MLHTIRYQLSLFLIKKKLFIYIFLILIICSIHINEQYIFCANEPDNIEELIKQLKDVPIFTEPELFNHELTKRLYNMHNFAETNNLYLYGGFTIAAIAIIGIGYFAFFKNSTVEPDSGLTPTVHAPEIPQEEILTRNPENFIPEITPGTEPFGLLNFDNPLTDFFINDIIARAEDQRLNEDLMLFLLDNQEHIISFIGIPPSS